MLKVKLLLILITCLLFAGKKGQAQGDFAPVGAEWYYAGNNYDYMFFWQEWTVNQKWVQHMQSVKDTTFLGVSCRKLDAVSYNRDGKKPDSLFIGGTGSFYLYDHADTVFAYNKWLGKFTPLYVFTAVAGDTICLPHFNPGYCLKDTFFCYIVDSVKDVRYDKELLKTWFTRAINQEDLSDGCSYNWGLAGYSHTVGDWVNNGQYARKLGGVGSAVTGLFPGVTIHNADAGGGGGFPSGWLSCYRDSVLDLKMTERPCDEVAFPRTEINKIGDLSTAISVYPNPVGQSFRIKSNLQVTSDISIHLFDLMGRKVLGWIPEGGIDHLTYDVGSLPNGVYILSIHTHTAHYHQKVILQH